MLIGFLGGTPFVVSSPYIYTFDNYTRNSAGRWAKHDLVGKKPVLEFIGPDVEEITYNMQLRADHGLNPRTELSKLRRERDQGTVLPLILGGHVIGSGRWVIKSIGEKVTSWTGNGQPLAVTVDINLCEYSGRTT